MTRDFTQVNYLSTDNFIELGKYVIAPLAIAGLLSHFVLTPTIDSLKSYNANNPVAAITENVDTPTTPLVPEPSPLEQTLLAQNTITEKPEKICRIYVDETAGSDCTEVMKFNRPTETITEYITNNKRNRTSVVNNTQIKTPTNYSNIPQITAILAELSEERDKKGNLTLEGKTKIALQSLRDQQCGDTSCLEDIEQLSKEYGTNPIETISLFMAETHKYWDGKVNPYSISYLSAVGPQIMPSNINTTCKGIVPQTLIDKLNREETRLRAKPKSYWKVKDKNGKFVNINNETNRLNREYGDEIKKNINRINECGVKFFSENIENSNDPSIRNNFANKIAEWNSGNGISKKSFDETLDLVKLGTQFYGSMIEAAKRLDPNFTPTIITQETPNTTTTVAKVEPQINIPTPTKPMALVPNTPNNAPTPLAAPLNPVIEEPLLPSTQIETTPKTNLRIGNDQVLITTNDRGTTMSSTRIWGKQGDISEIFNGVTIDCADKESLNNISKIQEIYGVSPDPSSQLAAKIKTCN